MANFFKKIIEIILKQIITEKKNLKKSNTFFESDIE